MIGSNTVEEIFDASLFTTDDFTLIEDNVSGLAKFMSYRDLYDRKGFYPLFRALSEEKSGSIIAQKLYESCLAIKAKWEAEAVKPFSMSLGSLIHLKAAS